MQRHKVLKRSTFIFLTFFLLISLNSSSHANNILFSCDFDSGSGNEWDRWQQCAQDYDLGASGGSKSDRYLDSDGLDGSNSAYNDASDGHAYTPLDIVFSSKPDEITTVYYEKFNAQNGMPISGANIKTIRVFNDYSNGDYQIGGINIHHFDAYLKMGTWSTGTLILGNNAHSVKTSTGYCSTNSDGTYTCDGTDGEGGEAGRVSLKWNPYVQNNTWYKIRTYHKMPTDDSTHDGEIRVWINDELIFKVTDLKIENGQNTHFEGVRWLPSDEGEEGFYHYLDKITVYKGLVEPSLDTNNEANLQIPSNLNIKS